MLTIFTAILLFLFSYYLLISCRFKKKNVNNCHKKLLEIKLKKKSFQFDIFKFLSINYLHMQKNYAVKPVLCYFPREH